MKNFSIPRIINPEDVRIIMVCEAMPEKENDYFYSSQDSLYVLNTVDAFNNAGIPVKNMGDIIKKGVYLTVAVKSPRKGLTVPLKKIENDSYVLEEELKMFPKVKAILLMGDAAIKALNFISKRTFKAKAVPSGSTYKIRSGKFYFGKVRVFPSYLQTGKNFLIEKSKQAMVAQDIKNAFKLL
ncbi:MAG: uracil-DNA glycosylase [Candidatus Omnitrophica bacterium]|nr:uracil-DNA glycosylase [Candidatus Omnitrophota bacterium]